MACEHGRVLHRRDCCRGHGYGGLFLFFEGVLVCCIFVDGYAAHNIVTYAYFVSTVRDDGLALFNSAIYGLQTPMNGPYGYRIAAYFASHKAFFVVPLCFFQGVNIGSLIIIMHGSEGDHGNLLSVCQTHMQGAYATRDQGSFRVGELRPQGVGVGISGQYIVHNFNDSGLRVAAPIG